MSIHSEARGEVECGETQWTPSSIITHGLPSNRGTYTDDTYVHACAYVSTCKHIAASEDTFS